ncbi:MAG: hypothetical protein ACREPM_00060 [Gemmatimonadaceae bacterium]
MSAMHRFVAALGCACIQAAALLAQVVATPALRVGDRLPDIVGRSLSGHDIAFPTVNAMRPTVVIISFSRDGGRDAQQWAERLGADSASSGVDVLVVAELESVPRLLRGAVRYTIKRSVPPNLRAHMLILDRNEAAWRQRLAVTSTARAYAVVVSAVGDVQWMSTGPCDDAQLAQARAATR